VRRHHQALLTDQQPRQHGMTARRQMPPEIGRHRHQGPGQDIGQDQVVRLAATDGGVAITGTGHHREEGRHAIAGGVAPGDLDRGDVDIGGQHLAARRLGQRDAENPRAAAEIEAMADLAPAQESVDGQQTAARGGMLARTESGPGIDLQRDAARRHIAVIM